MKKMNEGKYRVTCFAHDNKNIDDLVVLNDFQKLQKSLKRFKVVSSLFVILLHSIVD